MNLGMEGLDTAIEHLRETCEIGDIADHQAGIAERLGGTSGGDEFNVMGDQSPSKVDQAGLIGDGEEGATNGLEGLKRIEIRVHREYSRLSGRWY